jgi:starvation-inducible outer membrane lipoprotein
MNNVKRIVPAVALLLLAACAKLPDEITAAEVSSDPYMQMECPQLAQVRMQQQSELSALEEQQTKAAKQDGAAMSILHVPLASMRGMDRSEEVAAAKGRVAAVDRARQAKACA